MRELLQNPKIRLALIFSFLVILFALLYSQLFTQKALKKVPKKKGVAQTQIKKMPGLSSMSTQDKLLQKFQDNNDVTDASSTLTERAARDLIYAYISAKQSGKDIKDLEKILENEVGRVLTVNFVKYNKDDLNISEDFNLQNYKKNMQEALLPLTKIKDYELNTIALYIKEDKPESAKTLKEDIELYTQSITDLLQVPVSEDITVPQLALINAYSKLLASLQLIERSKNDIMLVYPGLKLFLEADAEIYSAFDALKLYVEKNI